MHVRGLWMHKIIGGGCMEITPQTNEIIIVIRGYMTLLDLWKTSSSLL